jgi:hypothetical protein
MDISALETALHGRDFAILSVTGEIPKALDTLIELGNVEVQRAETKTEAVSMIASRHYDLLIVEEDDDWDDVRDLIARAREGRADSIIVQGDGVQDVDHLRALLAGADSYAPAEEDEWTFKPILESSEKPLEKLARQLEETLSMFGPDVPGAMLEQIHHRVSSPSVASGIRDVVAAAALSVSATLFQPIAAVTLPEIRQVLDETTAGVPVQGGGMDTDTELSAPQPPEAGDELHWNVRFPQDAGILRNHPHAVTAGGEYPFETAVERTIGLEGLSRTLSAEQLQGKRVAYELTAANGAFRLAGQADWHSVVMSEGVECSADGTPPFRVIYRPGDAGVAEIQALLLVDGGSVARQTIELEVVGSRRPPKRRRSTRRDPLAIPAASIAERAGADLGMHLTCRTAGLWVDNRLTDRVEWLVDLPKQVDPMSRKAYRELRALSDKFVPQGDLTLLGKDGSEALLALARIGSWLHQKMFDKWITGSIPAEMRQLAQRIRGMGNRTNPPQLQLIAPDYPLPWGILYDRPLQKKNLTVENVDPNGFWGMRYDIYRDVVPTPGVLPRRGTRCWLKPIVGDTVPRGDQQLDFVQRLAEKVLTGDSLVLDPSSSPTEIRGWAESGDASDLLYFYCHAVPVDPFRVDGRAEASSSLVFGPTEQDKARVTLRQLRKWWNEPRLSHPVVILNACASGQSDAVIGAPFVDFFTKQWRAQAFVGTDWPIQAALADVVGQKLLAEICEHRVSLRQALRSVINAAAAKGNYFPLMYAIYGPSNVQFCAPS